MKIIWFPTHFTLLSNHKRIYSCNNITKHLKEAIVKWLSRIVKDLYNLMKVSDRQTATLSSAVNALFQNLMKL